MLLELRLQNFHCYRDEQFLSLGASADRDLLEVVRHPRGLSKESRGILPVAVIFGANASGKSALIEALRLAARAALRSFREAGTPDATIHDYLPFSLDDARAREPTMLELTFLVERVRHCFGFELQHGRVVSEWLFAWPRGTKRVLFLRGNALEKHGESGNTPQSREPLYLGHSLLVGVPEAKALAQLLRPDVLFVSMLMAQPNRLETMRLWLEKRLVVADLLHDAPDHEATTVRLAKDEEFRSWLSAFLRWADTGITAVRVIERDGPTSRGAPTSAAYTIVSEHVASDGKSLPFLFRLESAGTKRLYALGALLYDALRDGGVLVLDELTTGLHHWVVRGLVRLFQSPETNPNGAQLVFTTHDAVLADNTLLRRDQVVLVEKDRDGSSETYSISDVKEDKPRIGHPLLRDYMSGRYGGIPQIGDALPPGVARRESSDAR